MIPHSSGRGLRRVVRHISAGLAAVCGLTCLSLSAGAQTQRLSGHIPALVNESNLVGRVPAQESITLALTLPLRNQAQLNDFLKNIYDPHSPQYGQSLTPQQFTAQFGPTQVDYDAVAAYATAQGLTITNRTPNRVILNVTGPAHTVEAAFGLKLQQYRGPDGRIFRAPDANPTVPAAIGSKLQGIIGLDTSMLPHPNHHLKPSNPLAFLNPGNPPAFLTGVNPVPGYTGSGPGGGLSPSDIKTAYNLNVPLDGTGQNLALMELDGYTASDITQYEIQFGLPNVPLQNILVDGFAGTPVSNAGSGEVTLDIELQMALAPNINKIYVYEAPATTTGVMDVYAKIANDNLAKSVSTSWGFFDEAGLPASFRNAENTVFMQMAAQRQSMFAASGDSGAYANGTTLSVQDPASQPFITGVGGTRLQTNGGGGPYVSERAWRGFLTPPFDPRRNGGGSGGGISAVTPIPYWQVGAVSPASLGSTSMRNVPDVSLDADYNSGYAIYFGGSWGVFGGTSCAAPLWSSFTALVNQELLTLNKPLVGFANPTLYAIAATPAAYARDFHDIITGDNLFYPAVTGYDLSTGLGTFNGINLLNDLVGGSVQPLPLPVELLVNGGFENGAKRPQPWVASLSVIDNFAQYPAYNGKWKAWFAGYGSSHTDTLYQTVTIPNNISSARLSYELLVDAQQILFPVSTLTVQLRDTSGAVLQTLDQFTDLDDTYNPFTGRKEYMRHSYSLNVNRYKGKTVQLFVTGVDGNYLPVSFVADVFSLLVQPIAPVMTPPSGPPALPGLAR